MAILKTTTLTVLESSKNEIIAQVSDTIKSLEEKLVGIKEDVKAMNEAVKKIHTTLEKQKNVVDIILPNVFNKDSAIVVLLVLINTTLFNSVGIMTSVKSHVINSHEDITNIPPTELYVMFAAFTERHVIIEQLGIGLGDLKRTTLDAVYKIKGSIVIVYVRDPGSKQLKPGARFNRDIDCVTSQPDLIPLTRMGRFFSVFDKFTEFQKLSMHSMITDELSE